MTPIIHKYELDLTGRDSDNLVTGEPHDLSENGRDGLRVFVLNQGSFYSDSLIVRDANGIALKPNVDFITTYLYEEPTKRSGLEICGAVVVKNPRVGNRVYVDYQVVGGDYAFSVDALEQVLQALKDEDRPVEWNNIIGKPEFYPASGHLHALWELYGFEYLIESLERITQAVTSGDQGTFDDMRRWVKELYNDNLDRINHLKQRFETHISDYTNPHKVTKAQVGLGLVDNYPTASLDEIETGTAINRFVNVRGLVHGIDYHLGRAFRAHKADRKNPHQVTKAQVGLGFVDNFPTADHAEIRTGNATDRFITVEGLTYGIDYHLGRAFRAHKADRGNPHDVSKSQVGLSRVRNYSPASSSQAREAAIPGGNPTSAAYITPAVLQDAFDNFRNHNWYDHRYVKKESNDNLSLRLRSGQLQCKVGSTWRTIWPPQWQ